MRDVIHGLPLFTGLSKAALEVLDQHARESDVPSGHFIVREGEPGRHLFLIHKGAVRIFKAVARGECELARIGEGGFFGEMGILDRDVRSANAQAVGGTHLLVLPYVTFEILGDILPLDYARLMENLARELVRRLRQLDERFATGT